MRRRMRCLPSGDGCSRGKAGPDHESFPRRLAVSRAGNARACRVLPDSSDRRTAVESYRLRSVRARRHPQFALCLAAQLLGTAAPAAVLGRAGAHAVFRDRGRTAFHRGVAGRGVAAEFAVREGTRVLQDGAVRASRDDGRRRGRDLALFVQSEIRSGRFRAGASGCAPNRLAGRSTLGDANDYPVRGVEELRLQHDHSARRLAGDSARTVRSRAHRRRIRLAAVPPHHPADVDADPAAGRHPHRFGLLPVVRRTLRDHRRRSAAKHRQRALSDVRRRLQILEHGHRIGCGIPAVRDHVRRNCAHVALRRSTRGHGMKSRMWSVWINGALIACSVAVLFPLFWMLSVSFMQPGEASSLPPPMLPLHPTFHNYRELFEHAGLGRYFANSMFISVSITLLSLVCNTLAGYAFAKLRFAGREKLFGALVGGLVIPAQVAMLPLFLLLKYVGLVNTYAGVILPGIATVFGIVGIFLVRQYARGIPRSEE